MTIRTALILSAMVCVTGCGTTPAEYGYDVTTNTEADTSFEAPTCSDGVQNGDEEGIDCGGSCAPCVLASCTDGVMNGDEEGVDCGGACAPCAIRPTCDDGVMNGDEEGVDCGGDCAPCAVRPTCDDGIMNGGEEGIDCGEVCDLPCSPEPICIADGSPGCFTILDCRNMGLPDHTCDEASRCCVAPVEGCRADGEPCASDAQTTSAFVCDTEARVCRSRCTPFGTGECGADAHCQPFGDTWVCAAIGGSTPLDIGDDCDEADAPDGYCPEGSSCLNWGDDAAPDSYCTVLCDVNGAAAGCPAGDVCQPSDNADIGFCAEACEPYPRMGDGGYGCSLPGATCMPFDLDLDTWDDAQGTCVVSGLDRPYGEPCPGGVDDNFTYGCTDLGICLDVDFDADEEPFCRQLCAPFPEAGASQCPAGEVCSTLWVLLGGGIDFGYCERDISVGQLGDACVPVFDSGGITPCEDPGSLCIDITGAGAQCEGVCRVGFDDCPAGRTCSNPGFDPEQVPSFIGLCQ